MQSFVVNCGTLENTLSRKPYLIILNTFIWDYYAGMGVSFVIPVLASILILGTLGLSEDVFAEVILDVVKTDTPFDPVIAGTSLTYTIDVFNAGPSDATGVTVVDTLPAVTTFVSASDPSCVEVPVGIITCGPNTLPAFTFTIITITVDVPSNTPPGVITNFVDVTDDSGSADADIEDTTVLGFADSDNDGIEDSIDPLPDDDTNNSFDDGQTSGSIIRGDQILSITDEPNPDGVRIVSDPSGGPTPATITDCIGTVYTITPGDDIVITCASSIIQIIQGPVTVEFFTDGAIFATTTLETEDNITFDDELLLFTNDGTSDVVISVDGDDITLESGTSTIVGDGFLAKGQRNDVNEFLIYSSPSESKTNLPVDTTTFDLVLQYGETVNTSSFLAVLNGEDITVSFSPSAGNAETVTLVLEPGKNTLVLSIDGERTDAHTATEKDRLVFNVG